MFPTQEHIDGAQSSGEYWYDKTGFYSFPSFRLAQTAIESANGTALSGQNNYWGVKANKEQIAAGKFKVCKTQEVIKGKRVTIYDKFASYDSLKDGYIKQAELLVTSKLYEKSRHDNNPKQYAIDVGHVYATAPNYAKVVIAYMDEKNLYQYDHPEHQEMFHEPLRPPVTEEKKANAPAVAGAVIVGTAATTAASTPGLFSNHLGIIAAGIVVGLICAAVSFVKYRQAHQVLANILTPPTEAEKAEVAAAMVREPVGLPTPTPAT